MKSHPFKKPLRAGFTVIELLVVITIIALLFALTVGGYTYAQRSAARNRTTVAMNAIKSGLERYFNEFGEYPTPQNPEDSIAVGPRTYRVGGAAMLYQALSGDGYDAIQMATTPTNAGEAMSNGSLEEQESKNVMLTDMPKEIWVKKDGRFYMVDGFGNPFQYEKAKQAVSGSDPSTVNTTYDLWSYGEDEENTSALSTDTLTAGTVKDASQKWVKNW